MMAIGWERSVQRVLGNDVSVGPHGLTVLIPCKGPCAQVVTFATPKVMSPEGLRRKLEAEGWRIDRRRHCPECNAVKPHKEEKPVTDKAQLASSAAPRALSVVPPTAAGAPTDAARAVRRAVIQWLEEAYNVERQAYQAGVTDESIAKETGAALALVKQLREENYGPLAVPPELVEELASLQRQVGDMETLLSALKGQATATHQKLVRVAQKHGWAL
jgi:hypothetical protein